MSKTCCICGSTQLQQDEDIVFFNFPISAYLRRKWKTAIQFTERITYDTMVCSKHFEDSQYKTVRGKPRLCGKAVPSLLLNNKNITNSDQSTNEENKNNSNSETDINSNGNSVNITNIPETEVLLTEKLLTDTTLTHKPIIEENLTKKLLTEEILTEKLLTEATLTEKLLTEATLTEEPLTEKLIESGTPNEVDENNDKLDTEIKIDLLPGDKKNKVTENSETASVVSQPQKASDVTSSDEVPKENSQKVSEGTCDSNDSGVSDKPEPKRKESERICHRRDMSYENESRNVLNDFRLSSTDSAPDPKEDIEDLLTNYHIQNKGQLVTEAVSVEGPLPVPEQDPVFIEISVGRDSSAPADAPGSQDCLMVLESVQVDVDPSSFLLPEQEFDIPDDDDDVQCTDDKKPDPVSLLTSSDESDVILEEPKIDTVEVSDETDEDDVPLVRLMPKPDKTEKTEIAKIMWGLYEYYCIKCKFYSTEKSEYARHVREHEQVLQMCQICGFTTASKCQFDRHRRKHKDDRKFKCHLCNYRARHNMSLIYHLKTHEKTGRYKGGYSCRCGFHTDNKSDMLKHVQACEETGDSLGPLGPKRILDECEGLTKRHRCKFCNYKTNRRTDLKRHVSKKHSDVEDDEEYVP